jgi:tellurium resistance protein TerZ
MGISLNKGQTVSLAKTSSDALVKVRMGLGWDARKVRGFFGKIKEQDVDLDASCLLFSAAGELVDQVWFQQLKSKDGALVHTGDNRTGAGDGDDESIIVDLASVSPNVTTLVFVVSSYSGENFSQIENAVCRIVDEKKGTELVRFELSGAGPHTAQIMAKMTRVADSWDFTAVGTITNGRTIRDLVPAATAAL